MINTASPSKAIENRISLFLGANHHDSMLAQHGRNFNPLLGCWMGTQWLHKHRSLSSDSKRSRCAFGWSEHLPKSAASDSTRLQLCARLHQLRLCRRRTRQRWENDNLSFEDNSHIFASQTLALETVAVLWCVRLPQIGMSSVSLLGASAAALQTFLEFTSTPPATFNGFSRRRDPKRNSLHQSDHSCLG